MDFLVVYRRSSRELVSVDVFTDGNAAVQALNAADAGLNDIDIETVLLGAESFEALKVTHGRYFVSAPADLQPVGH
ncbi:MAG: hypothetical protein ACKORY_09370 [Actinomycetota bacterium]